MRTQALLRESPLTPAAPARVLAVDDEVEEPHSMTARTGSKFHPKHKTKPKRTTLPGYNEARRSRGDITIWLSNEAIKGWKAAHPPLGSARGLHTRSSTVRIREK